MSVCVCSTLDLAEAQCERSWRWR